MKKQIIELKETISIYRSRFAGAHLWVSAGNLSFHTILSILPLIGLVVLVLDLLRVEQRVIEQLTQFVSTQLNISSNNQFEAIFHWLFLNSHRKTLGWGGLSILIYVSWSLVTRFSEAIDSVFHAKGAIAPEFKFSRVKIFCRRAGVLFGMPVVISLSIFVRDWIEEDSWVRVLLHLKTVGPVFALPLSWSVEVLAFWAVYYLVPTKRVRSLNALKAALVVTLALEIARTGLRVYISKAFATKALYGVLSVVPFTLLWLQVSWAIALFGSVLLQPVAKRKHSPKATK